MLTVAPLSAPVDAAQRTFVASYGSDSNPCALTAPCRSFATAITHTDVDGEIIVLDSGGYGRVTVDRSVAITAAPGIYAGISVFAGTNGIDVNDPDIIVRLQGLTINGQGGDIGIAFTLGTQLYVDRCTVFNRAVGGMKLTDGQTCIDDSTFRENSDYGISQESGPTMLVIDQSRIERNGRALAGQAGVRSPHGGILTVSRSIVTGNYGNGMDVELETGRQRSSTSPTRTSATTRWASASK